MQPIASKWRTRDETKYVDFRAQTLWALAHVQESPLDKIYVLLMIFIGPLAQSSGRLPRNLKESCFQLVVRMQRVIKLREGMVKAKNHLSRYNESSQYYNSDSFCLLFSEAIEFCLIKVFLAAGSFQQSLEKCCVIHLCVCLYRMPAQCHKMANMIPAFSFLLNEWSLIFLMEFQANHFAYIKSRHLDNPKVMYTCTYDLSLKVRPNFLLNCIYRATRKGWCSKKQHIELFLCYSGCLFVLLVTKNFIFMCSFKFSKNIYNIHYVWLWLKKLTNGSMGGAWWIWIAARQMII